MCIINSAKILSLSPLLTNSVTLPKFSSTYLCFDKQQRALLSVNDFRIKLVQIIKCLLGRKKSYFVMLCFTLCSCHVCVCVFVCHTLLPINKFTLNISWGSGSGIFIFLPACFFIFTGKYCHLMEWKDAKVIYWLINLKVQPFFILLVYTSCHI